MAPKSSDDETNDGSSSVIQPTEPMEINTGDDDPSLLGKRKVETANLEDPGESEGDIDEDEDEDEDSDSDSEWDKDSFDGREYHSSDEENEHTDKEFEKRVRFYRRTVIETKATDKFPPFLWAGIATVPRIDDDLEEGLTGRQFLANMASLCLDKYNKRKGFNVKFEHILRSNFNPGGRTKYYITFAARESDSPHAPLVEYQAKVVRSAGKTIPILCRPTCPPKLVGEIK